MTIPVSYSNPTMGTTTKTAIGLAAPPTVIVNLKSGIIDAPQPLIDTAGLIGTRARILERQRLGLIAGGGSLEVEPVPEELDMWLQLATGTAKDGSNQFPLAETIPEFVVWQLVGPRLFKNNGCKINRLVFKAAKGGIMSMTADIANTTSVETDPVGDFPALSFSCTTPFVLMDCTVTIGGVVKLADNVEIDFFNDLDTERYFNSYTRTTMQPQSRIIKLRATFPFTDDELPIINSDETGIVGKVDFFNDVAPAGGGYRLTADFPHMVLNRKRPPIPGKTEVLYPVEFDCFKSCTGNIDEVTFTSITTAA